MKKFCLNVVALLALGLWLRRPPGAREVSLGSIDEPAVASAFARISRLPHFRLIRWLAMRELGVEDLHGTVVDLGSGPGDLSLQLATEAPGLTVVGVEPSPEMVQAATARAEAAGLGERLSFREGSAEAIPFPDASIAGLVCTASLHHWGDPVAGLREVGRVVRPGGRYVILDLRRDIALLPWAMVHLAQHYLAPKPLREAGEPSGSVKAAYTPEEVERMATDAGLQDFEVKTGPAWLILSGYAI